MGHMQSPPSPSKTSMLAGTLGEATGTGAGGGGEVAGAGEGILVEGNKNLPSPHISEKTTCQPACRFPLQL